MAKLAYLLALVAFVLATFDVTLVVDTVEQMVSGGLAFVALALLIGSFPRAPRA